MPKITVICKRCGKSRDVWPSQASPFCSLACYRAYIHEQAARTCPLCGKSFVAGIYPTVFCSPECSAKHTSDLLVSGRMDGKIKKMREGYADTISTLPPEEHWLAKEWTLRSPSGIIITVTNLKDFVYTSGSFDGVNPKYAYNDLRVRGSAAGWTLLSSADGPKEAHRRIPALPVPCPVCGKPMPPHRKTCSRECASKLTNAVRRANTIPTERVCPVCGKTFTATGKRVYCSSYCEIHRRRK